MCITNVPILHILWEKIQYLIWSLDLISVSMECLFCYAFKHNKTTYFALSIDLANLNDINIT